MLDRSGNRKQHPRMASPSSRTRGHLVLLSLLLLCTLLFFLLSSTSRPPPLPPPLDSAGTSAAPKIFLYHLPSKFTYGVIRSYLLARSPSSPASATSSPAESDLVYPGHQHSAEWYLFSDLLDPHRSPTSPLRRVDDPADADFFFVPFFSSLSLVVNPVGRPMESQPRPYSDEETQEELIQWLESQQWWRRNAGRDHVFVCQDPNALYKVIDRIRNSVLLISDFGRLRANQASLVKDVILPYSYRIRPYSGELGVHTRPSLLFFMGNRYRKEGGKIRNTLFQVLEQEDDVIIKHGTQSRESRRAAAQGMHSSKFCLHPAGDTPSACRLFDAIVSLCVPVIVSDYIELPFEDVIDYRKIAVFVETGDAIQPRFLTSMLRKVPHEQILRYQRELQKVRPYFEYKDRNGTVNEIWRQVSSKLGLMRMMINRDKRLVRKMDGNSTDCACLCSSAAEDIR